MAPPNQPPKTGEPVITATTITTAVMACLNVPVVLGWVTLDAIQLASINTAVLAVTNIVFGIWTRRRVTPV